MMARRSRLLVLVAPAALALGLATPARAELVVMAGGNVMKVKAYELDGERAFLTLPSGGRMTVALARIEHVVDDEVLPEPDPAPVVAAEAKAETAGLPLGFEESQPVPEGPFGPLIYETARRHSLNPTVVAAVIRAESAGNPRAVSRKGARGLMQLMPGTAKRFGVRSDQLFQPEHNLEAGVRYLKWLLERFPNDLPRALAAYNAGEGAVERYGGIPPYRETRTYVRRIFSTLGLTVADL